MNLVDELRTDFKITEFSQDASGVTWFTTGNVDVRELASYLRRAGARFVTITAYETLGDERFRLEYLWDSEGRLLGFPFYPEAKTMSSIYDICEAVDWIEREIHEEYAIDFTGREYEPLLLRAGEHAGVNLHEVGQ